MKFNVKSFICGMLVMGVLSGIAVYAADAWQTINVLPNTIKVVVEGKAVQADNFLYDDTTYLPIRAVSEALGLDVQYDGTTSTATISEKKEDNAVMTTSKYTPPAEYINDNAYVLKKDGIYYVLLNFIANKIQDAGYKYKYDDETRTIYALNGDKVVCSVHTILLENEPLSVIPYDQFVEEIEPLLK